LLINLKVSYIFRITLDGVIEATYANFGFIPYGRTIMGKVYFDKTNEFGCDEYSLED
jgi:hypothetical protein